MQRYALSIFGAIPIYCDYQPMTNCTAGRSGHLGLKTDTITNREEEMNDY